MAPPRDRHGLPRLVGGNKGFDCYKDPRSRRKRVAVTLHYRRPRIDRSGRISLLGPVGQTRPV